MKTKLFTLIIAVLLTLPAMLSAAEVSVYDNSINEGDKVYWTKDNIYVLEEMVFVENGAELHIEAGTVIWGKEGQELDAKALVIARGAKIFARGTKAEPIIFTAYGDDPYDMNDGFTLTETGLWGGLIILGKAPNNNAAKDYVKNIEGIDPNDPRAQYGETPENADPDDNSGVVRFVQIRHGGTDIGDGNEINGLTMGAVGAGTVIEYVEVWYNKDDGFEWFGGTVNCRYLVSAFNRDDSFDYDEGFNGNGQFWFSIQADNRGNRAGEHDGGNKPDDSKPYATPNIYNVTYIGSGVGAVNADSEGFNIRDNAGGHYSNSIFAETTGQGLEIEDLESGEDSRARLEAGDLTFKNNIWWKIGSDNTTLETIAPDDKDFSQDFVRTYLGDNANHNSITDPQIRGISRNLTSPDGLLDPRPEMASPAFSMELADLPDEGFFMNADYAGAFGPYNLWIEEWTFLSQSGLLASYTTNEVSVYDNSINAGDKVYWTKDNIYVLEEMVFVEDGAELYIEPGTLIWGKEGQELDAKALVICRGAKIFAEGKPNQPIIFTAYGDDPYDFNDGFTLTETGLWGGLIILGKAPNNNAAKDYVKNIEGVDPNDERGLYGETPENADPMDNSGVVRYVSIRHGGTDIGDGNEINGLTMGAVGAGTTIEFVEVWYNKDDGFEWFGGTVNTRNLVSAFNRDDSFDYDEGFNGKGQFWFSIQAENRGNRAGEHDGGNKPDDSKPYATPHIYNVTYIGSGIGSVNTDSEGFNIRDNAGGHYYNGIFAETTSQGLEIEDLESGEDSRARLEAGDLSFKNNIWWKIGSDNTTLETIAPDDKSFSQDFVRSYLGNAANNNWIEDPQFRGISRNLNTPDGGLDPRPAYGSPAFTRPAAQVPEGDDFLMPVDFIGAFGPGDLWLDKWTMLSQTGIVKEMMKNEISVYDNDINEGDEVRWTNDNIYVLEEMVFVENGAKLNIEPGTVIWGKEGQELDAKALVICRGGQIFAEGTPTQPIIFTAYGDDPYDMEDGFTLTETGLWGGLVLLGKAPNNNAAKDYVKNIEGIDPNDPRSLYGETPENWDPMDNSGIVKYVSIRHGGTDIGDGNEINGLTMGAVGAGTTIEYVEVWYNKDDGFEWFGGTVNGKYLASMFNRDDSFDYDEGFNGKGQFWFSIQADNRGNRGGEHDGGNKPDDSKPFAIPFIYNVTYIGSGVGAVNTDSEGFNIRDNAGGIYKNNIFAETTSQGLEIEDLESGEDSRARLEAGQLQFENNLWWKIANNNTTIDLIAPDDKDFSQQFVRDYLSNSANHNWIEDPQFYGVSRNLAAPDHGLDPRPMPGSPAYTKDKAPFYYRPDEGGNDFFEDANHLGAFGEKNWLADWSYASISGLLGYHAAGRDMYTLSANDEEFDKIGAVEEQTAAVKSANMIAYPNPMETNTTIEFYVKNAGKVRLSVSNMLGQEIELLADTFYAQGYYGLKWTPENLETGMYLIVLESNNTRETLKVIVK